MSSYRGLLSHLLMDGLTLVLLASPSIFLVLAWVLWGRSQQKFQTRLRGALLFSGLIACSISLALFWIFVAWTRLHGVNLLWLKMRDELWLVGNFLAGVAVVGTLIGKGRGRVALLAAAFGGYLLIWAATHLVGGTSIAYFPRQAPLH
jgi:hypothetical protein